MKKKKNVPKTTYSVYVKEKGRKNFKNSTRIYEKLITVGGKLVWLQTKTKRFLTVSPSSLSSEKNFNYSKNVIAILKIKHIYIHTHFS